MSEDNESSLCDEVQKTPWTALVIPNDVSWMNFKTEERREEAYKQLCKIWDMIEGTAPCHEDHEAAWYQLWALSEDLKNEHRALQAVKVVEAIHDDDMPPAIFCKIIEEYWNTWGLSGEEPFQAALDHHEEKKSQSNTAKVKKDEALVMERFNELNITADGPSDRETKAEGRIDMTVLEQGFRGANPSLGENTVEWSEDRMQL